MDLFTMNHIQELKHEIEYCNVSVDDMAIEAIFAINSFATCLTIKFDSISFNSVSVISETPIPDKAKFEDLKKVQIDELSYDAMFAEDFIEGCKEMGWLLISSALIDL